MYPRLTLHCTWGYNVQYTLPGVAPLQGVKNVSTLDPTLYLVLGVQYTVYSTWGYNTQYTVPGVAPPSKE